MSRTSLDCRSFEERLVERDDLRIPFDDPHPAVCPACARLAEDVRGNLELFARLARPELSPDLSFRLLALPADLAARAEAESILQLLQTGLATPEPSSELLGRLAFLPTRERALSDEKARGKRAGSLFLRILGDWRFIVTAAYAFSVVFVLARGIDPMSVARGAASNVTSMGGRAIAGAQETLQKSKVAAVVKPMRERLDYKVYRSLAAGKARAVAYSQLLFETVFGSSTESARRT